MGIHLQARAGEFRFLTGEEKWNDRKHKKNCKYWSPLYPGKMLLKSKGGSINFSDIQKYLTWLKLQECYQFSWFKNTLMISLLNSSVHQKSLLEKWHVIISNIGKPLAQQYKLAVSTRDRLHNSLFFFTNNTPTIRLSLHCSITMVGGHEKQSEFNTTSTSLSDPHWHQLCLQTGSLHHLCKMSGLIHNMLGWMRNKNNKLGSFRKNWLWSIVSDIEHCQQLQPG